MEEVYRLPVSVPNMSYKVKLTRIKSNHENLRTNEVEGETQTFPPDLNKPFSLIGQSLSGLGYRFVQTTPIVELTEEAIGVYRFKTLNSEYTLERLE